MNEWFRCLFVLICFLHLSSCDGPESNCLDPSKCPEKVQAQKTEKHERKW